MFYDAYSVVQYTLSLIIDVKIVTRVVTHLRLPYDISILVNLFANVNDYILLFIIIAFLCLQHRIPQIISNLIRLKLSNQVDKS